MKELIRTNNAVLLNYLEVLLRDAGIEHDVFDRNMSIMEGTIGILPRRILVTDEDYAAAKAILDAVSREQSNRIEE